MPKLEISSEIIEQAVHVELQRTIRDLFPSGLEYFYPSPPDLAQIVTDAIRYRYLRTQESIQDHFGNFVYDSDSLDREIDQAINKELDS